jgi:branched-chain amino acid transport system substrate-binding protein
VCAQDIRIAVVGSMTGPLAESGDEDKRGAEMAAKDINEAGGVNGRKIVLSIEDDACDPKQAVSVANHVIGEQITLVDGHSCSNASVPASPVYAEYSVLMMTPSSVISKLTDNAFAKGWPTIMRFYVRDDNQGKVIGAWMANRYKNKKIVSCMTKALTARASPISQGEPERRRRSGDSLRGDQSWRKGLQRHYR